MERPAGTVHGSDRSATDALNTKTLRVAVIGLGVGAQHAAAYARHPSCRVALLCDSADEKLAEARKLYPKAALTDSADEALTHPDIDLVSIATFDDAHFAMVLKALNGGKHVFVEKPLCQSAEQLQQLYKAWRQHGGKLKLASNLVLRRAPLYLWLKEQIQAGRLGEIYAIDAEYLYGRVEKITLGWRSHVKNYSAMEGGGVHMTDLMLWLTGQKPNTATTWGNRIATRDTAFQYDDFMAATLEFPSGMLGRITANFGCVHKHQHVLRVFGTRGTFIFDDAGARLHTSRDPVVAATPVNLAPKPDTKGVLISDFVDAVLYDRPIDAETQFDFDVMSVLIASDQSLATKKSQKVNYLCSQ